MTVSWVTWPRDDDGFAAFEAIYLKLKRQETTTLSSSRKLLSSLWPWPTTTAIPEVLNNLARHHHRRRRRDSDRDPDPAGNCAVLREFGLESAVQWGTSSGNYSHQVIGDFDCYSTTAYLSGALHHVIIGDLEGPLPPGTRIYYRVGDPGREVWSEEFSFASAPPLGPLSLPYTLGLLGDLGQTEHSASTLEHLASQDVDSVVMMGDLSYADGYQPRWDTWGRFVEPHTSQTLWMYCEGNHEIEPSNVAPDFLAYSKRFRMPHRQSGSRSNVYYSYDIAGIHLIMLGSYTDYDAGSEQFAWLRRDLASIDRSKTPWVVATMHAPWYNSNHNHFGDGEQMRQAMEGLLYEHGVDAVLAGHVHAYERSVGVYDNQIDPCGPLYINIGDGGNREGLDFDYYGQPEWSAVRDPSYGHAVIEFENATHAYYRWHRNQDGIEEVADIAVLERDPACRVDGKQRLLALMAARKQTRNRRLVSMTN